MLIAEFYSNRYLRTTNPPPTIKQHPKFFEKIGAPCCTASETSLVKPSLYLMMTERRRPSIDDISAGGLSIEAHDSRIDDDADFGGTEQSTNVVIYPSDTYVDELESRFSQCFSSSPRYKTVFILVAWQVLSFCLSSSGVFSGLISSQ
jgi:hypothetical protein